MKRTKQSTFARRERSEKSTGFAPVGGEDMTQPAKHTPGPWELYSKHRDEQYVDEPLAEEMRPLFRIHWDNNVSDTEAEQGAAIIAAAPAMYEALQAASEWINEMGCDHEEGQYPSDCLVHIVNSAIAQAQGQPQP